MSEFAMLNFGMFDSFIPSIIGKHEAKPQKGYEMANELTLRFLNIHAKNKPLELFDEGFIVKANPIIDTTFILESQPAPPNITRLKDLFIRSGMEAIDSTYRALKNAGNPQPFSTSFYPAYRNWLAWKKDPDYSGRLKLYQLAFDSYPESARINYYLGNYLQKNGFWDQARRHFDRTIQLLEAPNEQELRPAERLRIRQNVEQAMKELN